MYRRFWYIIICLLVPIYLLSAEADKQTVIKEVGKGRPWIGVVVHDLSKKMLENLNLDNGVKIIEVTDKSPAAEVGLQKDDIIISLDGQGVTDTENLIDLVQEKKIGEVVKIEFLRTGERHTVEVKLAQAPMKRIKIRTPRIPYRFHWMTEDQTWLGVYTIELTDQLRTYFAVPEGQGVLIKEVVKDSPADKGGLKAGDIIIKVAQKKVRDVSDIKRAINYFEPGDEIEIKVIREKKEKSFNVKLEEREQKENYGFYGDEDYEYEIPMPIDLDIDLPEIEINKPDIDIDEQQLLEELPQKIELQMKGLEVKLKDLDKKLQNMKIEISGDMESEI